MLIFRETPKIIGFLNVPLSAYEFVVTSVAEDGEVLANVIVRSEREMLFALGMDGRSLQFHNVYKAKYQWGFELMPVRWNETKFHPYLLKAANNHLTGVWQKDYKDRPLH